MRRAVKVVHKKLGREKAMGQAIFENNEIQIDSGLRGKDYFDTAIHELLHIYFPDLSEKRVASVSRRMCNCLWKLNFRRIDQ